MAKCLSKRCDQEIQAGFSFCPKCGRDNRPTEFRPVLLNCGHKFVGKKPFCVLCGAGKLGAKSVESFNANMRFGKSIIGIGILANIGAFAVTAIVKNHGGPGFSWISSWYGNDVVFPGHTVVHGADLPTYAMFAGAGLIFFGGLGTIAALANRGRVTKGASAPKA